MTTTPNAEWLERAANSVPDARRCLAARGLLAFAQVYLPHHFRLAPSPMHRELDALLMAMSAEEGRGQRLAVAAPRGHAKSTLVSLAYVLWSLAFGTEPFIWLVSATKEQAQVLLKHVRDELESNPLLRSDFPSLARGGRPWRADALQFGSGAKLWAVGVDQSPRGVRHRHHRPTLIVVDDAETTEGVRGQDQRDKLREGFERTLLKAGDGRTNVVVVGTVLHYDSLLARLLDPAKSPGWTARRYQALPVWPERRDLWDRWASIYAGAEDYEGARGPGAADAFLAACRGDMFAGAQVLWPEREPLETLMVMRVREGAASFDCEKQNEPLDPDRCLFKESALRYWDDGFADEAALLAHLRAVYGGYLIYGAWDPSTGTNPARGDFSAVVVVARVSTGACYVLHTDLARRTPSEMIARIVDLARHYAFDSFVLENNGFQDLLVEQLRGAAERAGVTLRLRPATSTAGKAERIELLEPLVSRGMLLFHRRHGLLLEQLRQFPLGAHDDGPDALEMAVRAPRRRDLTIREIQGPRLPLRPGW